MHVIIRRAVGFAYYAGLMALLFSGGGFYCLKVIDVPAPSSVDANQLQFLTILTPAIALTVVGSAMVLARKDRRQIVFGTIVLIVMTAGTLFVSECLARRFVPSWPAMGLHGVDPNAGAKAWGRIQSVEGSIGFNTWGQRDRERTVEPSPGIYRIAFVGDSFLEESSIVPVSLRVEQRIGRDDVEVLNLGVSATDPEEYYYRTKNIALPLGISHCVVFIFSGNDFEDGNGFVKPARSLESFFGIVSIYPRGSLFSVLGLRAVNHLLTNSRRPVLQAWSVAGDLNAREESLKSLLADADDATMRQYLTGVIETDPQQRFVLVEKLNRPEMHPFFAMLREPDDDLFRSYYLSSGLWSASVGGGQWLRNSEENAYAWVKKTYDLCRRQKIAFTLVIVPEAFQVDSRMYKQWMPLTDMRQLTHPCRAAAMRFAARAHADRIDLIDLHNTLQDVPGTYLNLDGHWSRKGVELVSEVLAAKLNAALN